MNSSRFFAHLVICRILDRMIHQDVSGILHAEGLALSIRGLVKLARRDRDCRNPLNFKPYSVVQTARRA